MPLQVLRAIGSDRNPYTVLVFGSKPGLLDDGPGGQLFRLSSGHKLMPGVDAGTFSLVNGELQLKVVEY